MVTIKLPSVPNYRIKELQLADGRSPFGSCFASLDAIAAAKVRVALSRIEQGNLSSVDGSAASARAGSTGGPGLRIYLAQRRRDDFILLGGGTKRRQQRDIDLAVARWDDYKRRKASSRKGT